MAVITAIGAIATAIAVGVGVYQLRVAKGLAQAAFEDELTQEYRSVVAALPVAAFYVDSTLTPTEDARQSFLTYVNLSNHQLWLADHGRISNATAAHWKQAITDNLELPAFRSAWDEIAASVPEGFFGTLRDEVPPRRLAERET